MKQLIILLLLGVSFNALAQSDTIYYSSSQLEEDWIHSTIKSLQEENSQLKVSISSLQTELGGVASQNALLKNKLVEAETRIENIERTISDNQFSIDQAIDKLGNRIDSVGNDADTKIGAVGHLLNSATTYAVIGGIIIFLIIIAIYLILRYKQKADRTDFLQRIDKAKSSLEEDVVKEFSRHTELMSAQLESQPVVIGANTGHEPDHSLALKLANEINLIERNLSFMDPGTKGLKQLQRSVSKLKDNLAANGYEMPVLLGELYKSGMNMIISSSMSDETIEKDKEIITKVVLPQINYDGKIIQTAQVEISVGV